MKILFITGFYPPYAPVAATRMPKMAKYFHAAGHDVHVLGAKIDRFAPILSPELPEDRCHYAHDPNIDEWPDRMYDKVRSLFAKPVQGDGPGEGKDGAGSAPAAMTPGRASLKSTIKAVYREVVNYPDNLRGWVGPAIAKGHALIAGWRPDLIYVSAPPHSSVLVGAALAKHHDIPFVPEFRDAWTPNPYYDNSPLRRVFESRLERRLLRQAAGIVAVTDTWARYFAETYDKPTAKIMNGFDPADFDVAKSVQPLDPGYLTLLYAGSIYLGKRDPETLFAAMATLGDRAKQIAVHFYVEWPGNVMALAQKHGVEAHVVIHKPVSYAEITTLERAVDALLLLRWDHPGEDGVLAGKLFEYIAAERPILSLGSVTGEAADIIRREEIGLVTRSVEETATQLHTWLDEKQPGTLLPPVRVADRAAYGRPRQFAALEGFLQKIISS